MEDASKALLISAGVLIGILILSLGVYLYYSLGTYITVNQETMNKNELNQFNTQFIKYINYEEQTGTIEVSKIEFELTIHDVVTAANLAYENNRKYNMTSLTENYDESTLYVTVNADIAKEDGTIEYRQHLEKQINVESSDILKNNINQKYICRISDITYSSITGRICSISFTKIP